MNSNIDYFEKNIIPMRRQLMTTASRYLPQPEDAEDAVQETFLRIWTNRLRLSVLITPEAFAMQTLVNICIDRLRKRREELMQQTVEPHDMETPYSRLELHDAVELIGRIIDTLPYTQRTVIRMRDVEGYDLQEIATIMDTQLSAVRVNLSRARKLVKEEFIKANKYIRL
jgi:RNA polymerase sigma-70 factor (ECF subfamily)